VSGVIVRHQGLTECDRVVCRSSGLRRRSTSASVSATSPVTRTRHGVTTTLSYDL